jgi:hypothetical protein
MPAEAASVDLDRRDPDVPILAAIIGELQLPKIIDVARGGTTHAPEV